MDFGKSQVVDVSTPVNTNYAPSPIQEFEDSIGNLLKLANTNKLPAFQGGSKLDLNSIDKNPNLTSDEKYKLTQQLFQQTPEKKLLSPTSVSLSELDPYMNSRDFKDVGYNPFQNNEQKYIDNRTNSGTSWKIANKFGVNTLVGALSTITPLGTGIGYLSGTDYGKQWSDKLASWQKEKETYNQIYYTPEETKASGMNPFTTPTKFFDNLLPSIGFTVGNIAASYFTMRLGGAALLKGTESLMREAEFFRGLQRSKVAIYRGIKGLDKAAMAGEKGLLQGADATVSAMAENVNALQGTKSTLGKIAEILPYSFYSGAAEGHIEASTAKQEFYQDWLAKYKQDNDGRMPSPDEQIKRKALAEEVYDETLKYNTVVLTLTNTLEIGSFIKKMGITGELLKRSGLGKISKAFDVDDVIFRGLKTGWEKKTTKELILPYLITSSLEAGGEAFEEASQYAISNGTKKWATQRFENPNPIYLTKDLNKYWDTNSLKYITSSSNMDQEMKSNAYFGFLSGFAMSGGTKIYNSIENKISKSPDIAQKRVDLLNKGTEFLSTKFMDAHENKANNLTENAKVLEKAIKENNIFALQNIKFADLYSWTANSIAAGGFDLRIEQLLDLKKLSKDEFESFFNLEFNDKNKENVNSYLDSIIENGKEISKDIEQFRNMDNVYKFHAEPEDQLTDEQKEENKNHELFDNVKYEMAYSYSRLKNFNKRSSDILSNLETSLGGTTALTNLKKILFSPEGIDSYKDLLLEEIKTLKKDLQTFEGEPIFKADFNKKQQEIKERETILNSLNTNKEDIDKFIDSSKDELTENQKQNLIGLTKRSLDVHNLHNILKYEVNKLQKSGFELKLGNNNYLDVNDMVSAISQPIVDLYNINSSKGIVSDNFNRLNTKKGAKEFIENYKILKDRFDNSKSINETSNNDFLNELKSEYIANGYPENAQVVGVELDYFKDSDEIIEDNPESLKRLLENKDNAKNSIIKIKEVNDKKEEVITFITEFNTLNSLVEVIGKSKEDVEKKIEQLFEKAKTLKAKKEQTGKFIIQRVKQPIEKNANGKLYTPIKYIIVSESGAIQFNNKEFTNEEIKDFLKGIKNIADTNIRKYKIIPFSEFKKLNIKVNQLKGVKKKIESLSERMTVVNGKLTNIVDRLNSDIFKQFANDPINDFLNSQYITLYSIQGNIKKIEKERFDLVNQQLNFSQNYKNSKNTNKGWQNTTANKQFIQQLKEIENRLVHLKQISDNILEIVKVESSKSEEAAMYYSQYRTIIESYIELINERDVLHSIKKELFNNYQEIFDEKTTEVIDFKAINNEKEKLLFEGLTEENKDKMISKLDDILKKEKEIMTIQTLFVEQQKQLKKQHSDILKQIQNIRQSIDEVEQYADNADIQPLYTELTKLNLELNTINDLITNIDQKINLNAESISNQGAEFEKTFLDDYRELRLMEQTVANVSKALAFRDNKLIQEGLTNAKSDLFNQYTAQRKVTFFGGEEQTMEVESAPYDYSGGRYKSNAFMQSTGRDITTEQDEKGNHIIPSQEEINSNPSIEFYRFLASESFEDIIQDYDVMLITPKFLELNSSNPIFKDLIKHINKQFERLSELDPENDIFQVIVEKGTNIPLVINNQFLTASLYKPSNKFETNLDGSLIHVTEKKVLGLFKTSEEYLKNIENKSDEEIVEYIKEPETLKQAIKYAKDQYTKELTLLKNKLNTLEGKIITSSIKDITNGIFIKGNRQSVLNVMDKSDMAIGLVVEEGFISYRDENGLQQIPTNISLGNTVMVNVKTKKWIPVETRNSSEKEVDEILGILDFTIDNSNKSNQSIHEICNSKDIKIGDKKFQLFSSGTTQHKIEKIPLYPRFGIPFKTTDEKRNNWFRRWSIMTTYFNYGSDKKNPKNTFYFTHKDDLGFYNNSTNKIEFVSKEKLQKLLEAWFNNTTDLLDESEQNTINSIVNHIKNKKRNISAQYALFSDSKFSLPQYDHKTKTFSFKMFDSYLDYVVGNKSLDSGLVSTTTQKADGRFNFQQSLILSDSMKIDTTEFDAPTSFSQKTKKTEENPVPTESKKILMDVSEQIPEQNIDEEKESMCISLNSIVINEGKYNQDGYLIVRFNAENKPIFVIYKEDIQSNKTRLGFYENIVELYKEFFAIDPKEKLQRDLKASELRKEYTNLLFSIFSSKNNTNQLELTNNALFQEQIKKLGEIKTIETLNNEVLTFDSVKNSPFGALYTFKDSEGEKVYLVGDRLIQNLDNGNLKKVAIISDESSSSTSNTEESFIDNTIKDKIAKIEKRRQEKLNIFNVGDKINRYDSSGKFQDVVEVVENRPTQIRFKQDDGTFINKPKGQLNADGKLNTQASYRVLDFDKINTESDAELAAIAQQENTIDEKTLEGFSSSEDLNIAFLDEYRLFDLLKEANNTELNGFNNLEELYANKNMMKLIGKHGGIKDFLIKLYKKDNTSDSLNDLTIEKILKNNPNIKKSC